MSHFKSQKTWMRSDFCLSHFQVLKTWMSHFKFSRLGWVISSSQDLDESFQVSKDLDEAWHPVFGFLNSKGFRKLEERTSQRMSSLQDLDELVLLFNCHLKNLVWSTLIGRNEPKRSISSLSRLGWGLGIPVACHSRRTQHAFCEK